MLLFLLVYVYERFPARMSVSQVSSDTWEGQKMASNPRSRVAQSCELLCVYLLSNPAPLQEQQVLLVVASTL